MPGMACPVAPVAPEAPEMPEMPGMAPEMPRFVPHSKVFPKSIDPQSNLDSARRHKRGTVLASEKQA